MRHDHLTQVLGRVEGVSVKAVTQLTRQTAHVRVDSSDVDWHLGVGDLARTKKRGHEGEGIELAREVQWTAILPAVPNGAQGLDHLAQLTAWRLPLDAKAALVVALDLGAKPQDKAAV